ncbi:MAG: hypothetical protein FD161_4818, partial [Limisphaerales bacterium]
MLSEIVDRASGELGDGAQDCGQTRGELPTPDEVCHRHALRNLSCGMLAGRERGRVQYQPLCLGAQCGLQNRLRVWGRVYLLP